QPLTAAARMPGRRAEASSTCRAVPPACAGAKAGGREHRGAKVCGRADTRRESGRCVTVPGRESGKCATAPGAKAVGGTAPGAIVWIAAMTAVHAPAHTDAGVRIALTPASVWRAGAGTLRLV